MSKSKLSDLFLINPKAHRIAGRRVRDRRKALMLDLTTVAKHVGISVDTLQSFESGTKILTESQLHILHSTLRRTPDELYQGIVSVG